MNLEFWRGKRVFVTGHTGFKGSWLVLWLEKLGANVTGFALNPVTTPSLFNIAQVASGIRSVIDDIRDFGALSKAMQEARPDIVIHMAAQALVRESYNRPLDTYSVNVIGTANVLEAVRAIPSIRSVLIVTTDKCYENKEWSWGYREIDRLGGYDPYSNSKACAELVTSAYRSSFFNPAQYQLHRVGLASARAGNVIGGGDWSADRLLPDVLSSLAVDQVIKIRNPKAIRPWQHVLAPLSGYLLLCEKLFDGGASYSEGWNLGPNDEDCKSVEWVVAKTCELWGVPNRWNPDDQPKPHEASFLKLDCSKAHTQLNWKPHWRLSHSLSAVVDWHKAYVSGEDMRLKTLAQITEYENSIL